MRTTCNFVVYHDNDHRKADPKFTTQTTRSYLDAAPISLPIRSNSLFKTHKRTHSRRLNVIQLIVEDKFDQSVFSKRCGTDGVYHLPAPITAYCSGLARTTRRTAGDNDLDRDVVPVIAEVPPSVPARRGA